MFNKKKSKKKKKKIHQNNLSLKHGCKYYGTIFKQDPHLTHNTHHMILLIVYNYGLRVVLLLQSLFYFVFIVTQLYRVAATFFVLYYLFNVSMAKSYDHTNQQGQLS